MDKKRIWLWIGLGILFVALMAGMWVALIKMGQDPWEVIRPRPIGPVLPPIRIPKV